MATKLLAQIGAVTLPNLPEFVVEDKFLVDTSKSAPIKIAWIGSNFREWFFGKTEAQTAATTLCYATLLKPSVDGPILVELGETAETTLGHVFAMMTRQPSGEQGHLLTNGLVNIFYVRDVKGLLRAVFVGWDGGGWFVSADSVEDPRAWGADGRVFSRNSKSLEI